MVNITTELQFSEKWMFRSVGPVIALAVLVTWPRAQGLSLLVQLPWAQLFLWTI